MLLSTASVRPSARVLVRATTSRSRRECCAVCLKGTNLSAVAGPGQEIVDLGELTKALSKAEA